MASDQIRSCCTRERSRDPHDRRSPRKRRTPAPAIHDEPRCHEFSATGVHRLKLHRDLRGELVIRRAMSATRFNRRENALSHVVRRHTDTVAGLERRRSDSLRLPVRARSRATREKIELRDHRRRPSRSWRAGHSSCQFPCDARVCPYLQVINADSRR
jgi:hypothetical protein